MYRGTVRTIVVRNVNMVGTGDKAIIPVPSRSGSPYYRIVAVRGTNVSGAGATATFVVVSDAGGFGNIYVSSQLLGAGSAGGSVNYSLFTGIGNGSQLGSIRWTASFLQSSPFLYIRSVSGAGNAVVDFEIDIEDIGQPSAPVVSDNAMSAIRNSNVTTSGYSRVYAVGNNLYLAGGNLTVQNGSTRQGLTVWDLTTGLPTALSITVAGGAVFDAAIDPGNGDIYLGGSFTSINGTARNRLACVDSTGALKAWNPDLGGAAATFTLQAKRMLLVGSVVYFVGDFTTIGGVTRNCAAAVDTSGVLQAWNPNIGLNGSFNAAMTDMCVFGTSMMLFGNIKFVGGVARTIAASVDLTTGALLSWAPFNTTFADKIPACAETDGTLIYIGLAGNIKAIDAAGADTGLVVSPAVSANRISLSGVYLSYTSPSSPTPPSGVCLKATGANVNVNSYQSTFSSGAVLIDATRGLYFVAPNVPSGNLTVARFAP